MKQNIKILVNDKLYYKTNSYTNAKDRAAFSDNLLSLVQWHLIYRF